MKRYAIEILEIEHANILRMTQVMRRMALRMMEEKTLFVDDIRLVIDWIRGYADKHHHGKEEVILFDEMVKELGDVGERLIRGAMYIEHDAGRYHVSQMEEAVNHFEEGNEEVFLDGITHVLGYAELLKRHALKENEVIYPFGLRSLDEKILDSVDERTKKFEEDFSADEYLEQLEQLEEKYQR